MKEFFKKIGIFFLGFCLGGACMGYIIHKNLWDSIPWEEEIHENTLEWIVEADNMEYLSNKLSQEIKDFWEQAEILFPALAEQ